MAVELCIYVIWLMNVNNNHHIVGRDDPGAPQHRICHLHNIIWFMIVR